MTARPLTAQSLAEAQVRTPPMLLPQCLEAFAVPLPDGAELARCARSVSNVCAHSHMLKAPCAVLRAACKRARANTERALLPVSMCKAWMWHGHHEPVRPTASAVACTQVLHLSGAAACMQVSHAPGITALHALQHPWANMTLCVHSSALKRGCLPARGRDRAARFAGPCAQRVNRSLPRMRPAHVTRSSELEGVDAFMRELLGLLEHCMGKLPLEQVRAAAQAGRRNAYECHRLQVKDAGVEGACVCVLVCVCVCVRAFHRPSLHCCNLLFYGLLCCSLCCRQSLTVAAGLLFSSSAAVAASVLLSARHHSFPPALCCRRSVPAASLLPSQLSSCSLLPPAACPLLLCYHMLALHCTLPLQSEGSTAAAPLLS